MNLDDGDPKKSHAMNLERFKQVTEVIRALLVLYGIPNQDEWDENTFKDASDAVLRARGVFIDLLAMQDELIEDILKVDPDFGESN